MRRFYHKKGHIAYFYCTCVKRSYFRSRFEDFFSWFFFIRKAERPPYFYFRFIWPTDLESVPRVEPPTLIISTKLEVDTIVHRRITALLVRIRYMNLSPWPLTFWPWTVVKQDRTGLITPPCLTLLYAVKKSDTTQFYEIRIECPI